MQRDLRASVIKVGDAETIKRKFTKWMRYVIFQEPVSYAILKLLHKHINDVIIVFTANMPSFHVN